MQRSNNDHSYQTCSFGAESSFLTCIGFVILQIQDTHLCPVLRSSCILALSVTRIIFLYTDVPLECRSRKRSQSRQLQLAVIHSQYNLTTPSPTRNSDNMVLLHTCYSVLQFSFYNVSLYYKGGKVPIFSS